MREGTVRELTTALPNALPENARPSARQKARQDIGQTEASTGPFQDNALRSPMPPRESRPPRKSRPLSHVFPKKQLHAKSIPCPPSQAMAVKGLNHFNITASPALIERVKQFYIDVVGLTIGPRADLDHGGYWLYAGKQPILHLSARLNMEPNKAHGEGFFNHISLSCVGLRATVSKLLATGTPYQVAELSDVKQTQVFITDPAGIGVELTFFNERL